MKEPLEPPQPTLPDGMAIRVDEGVLKALAEAGHPGSEATVDWGEPDALGFYEPVVTVRYPVPVTEVTKILTTVSDLMRRLSLDFPEGPISPEYRDVQMMLYAYEKKGLIRRGT